MTLGVVFSLVDNASSDASFILRSWDELRVSFDYGLLDSLMHGTDTAPRSSTVVSVLLAKGGMGGRSHPNTGPLLACLACV